VARCDESISTGADGSGGGRNLGIILRYPNIDGSLTIEKDERKDEETDEAKGDNDVGNEIKDSTTMPGTR